MKTKKNHNVYDKWFPLHGERAHSLLFFVCTLIERWERLNNNRPLNLPRLYNILHRLQVPHLIPTFIIHNKYIYQHYLYAYIHIIMNHNPFYKIDTINIRYKLLATYRSRQEVTIYISTFGFGCLCCRTSSLNDKVCQIETEYVSIVETDT